MALSRLNEMGYLPDVIERQLTHAEGNKVRTIYNRVMAKPVTSIKQGIEL